MENNLAQQIMIGVQRAQLPFKLDSLTQGDGNCFFRGVWSQCQRPQVNECLAGTHGQIKDYKDLRNKVASFMQKSTLPVIKLFKEKYRTVLEPVTGESWDDYWKIMRKDKEWADAVSVQGTAWYLNHDLLIIMSSATSDSPFITISGNWSLDRAPCPGVPLLLGYVNGLHYQSP